MPRFGALELIEQRRQIAARALHLGRQPLVAELIAEDARLRQAVGEEEDALSRG